MDTLNESYLNRCLDEFSREQMKIIGEMKNGGKESKEERKVQQQLTLLNNITMNIMKLRNLKKKESEKF
jgi:hypothetical protein